LARGGECALAHLGHVAGDRKNRQQPVAHEFQHLGAMLVDHRNLTIEIAIEEVDQHPRRLTIGECGKPAHIRQPDDRVYILDIAAPDLSGEDTLAGVMPDIGIEQGARRPPQRSDLGDPRQRSHNCFDTGDLCIGETSRLPGRAGDDVVVLGGGGPSTEGIDDRHKPSPICQTPRIKYRNRNG